MPSLFSDGVHGGFAQTLPKLMHIECQKENPEKLKLENPALDFEFRICAGGGKVNQLLPREVKFKG
jgi:hypothetical protein